MDVEGPISIHDDDSEGEDEEEATARSEAVAAQVANAAQGRMCTAEVGTPPGGRTGVHILSNDRP